MDDKGPVAVAWSMRRPPYLSKGGRKMRARLCNIMLIDNYVLFGSGCEGDPLKYRAVKYQASVYARDLALVETQRVESEGYELHVAPRSLATKEGSLTTLDKFVGPGQTDLSTDASFRYIFMVGKPVE